MKFSKAKYKFRKIASVIFLLAYLSFVITGIFHSHSGQISLTEKTVFSENINALEKDPYSDGDSHCLIHLLTNTVESYFQSSNNLICSLDPVDIIPSRENTTSNETVCLTAHSLRAPPEQSL